MVLLVCLVLEGSAAFSAPAPEPAPDSVEACLRDYLAADRILTLGKHRVAADTFEGLLKRAEGLGEKELLLFVRNGLATSLRGQDRGEEAERLYRRNLAAIPPEDSALLQLRLRTLTQLSTLYLDTRQYGAADRVLRQLASIPGLSQMPVEEAWYHSSLGLLQCHRGQLTEAEITLREGLRRAESKLAGPNRGVATLLNSLGVLAHETRRPAEAAKFFGRALAMTDSELGPHHPLATAPLLNLAAAQFDLGEFGLAEKSAARAVVILDEHAGSMHRATGRALTVRAAALRKLRRNGEAKTLEKRASAILAAAPATKPAKALVDVSDLR